MKPPDVWWPSVNFDNSKGMWTNEGFSIDPHPSSLLDDSFMNCSGFIKNGEGPSSLTGTCNISWNEILYTFEVYSISVVKESAETGTTRATDVELANWTLGMYG